jgi:hypothetical protein
LLTRVRADVDDGSSSGGKARSHAVAGKAAPPIDRVLGFLRLAPRSSSSSVAPLHKHHRAQYDAARASRIGV